MKVIYVIPKRNWILCSFRQRATKPIEQYCLAETASEEWIFLQNTMADSKRDRNKMYWQTLFLRSWTLIFMWDTAWYQLFFSYFFCTITVRLSFTYNSRALCCPIFSCVYLISCSWCFICNYILCSYICITYITASSGERTREAIV